MITNNILDDYYVGMPCMLGQVVGKIVGESDEGSWGEINGVKAFSIPLFSTPHGSVIKTGFLKLSKITEDGLELLEKYEGMAKENPEKFKYYGGYLEKK